MAADKDDPLKFTEVTFRGRSFRKDDRAPTLEEAIENAWEVAKRNGQSPGTFRVLDISFAADNPISEYSIIIGRHI